MKLLVMRIEGVLKSLIKKLATERGKSMGKIVRDLARIGIRIEKEGGVKIIGPLGFKRSLAKLDFGGSRERLSVWLDEELIEELGTVFKTKIGSANREALRLGILMFKPGEAKIRGPFGFEYPLFKKSGKGESDTFEILR